MASAVTVLADDLTGANATGALFARMGMRTRTITGSAAMREGAPTGSMGEVDVTVVTTGTRAMSGTEAAGVIRDLLQAAPALAASPLLAKRVDTTLRGPIGAELEAVLTSRRRLGRPVVAVAVPAYPSAGRTTVHGIHLLHGRPVAETAAGRDPLTPVNTSRVSALMTAGTGMSAEELHVEALQGGTQQTGEAIARALSRADVVVLDAATDEELSRLATAVSRARELAHIDVVPVDSGPFAAALCAAVGIQPSLPDAPVLLVIGSTAEPTTLQIEHAVASRGLQVLPVDPERGLEDLVRTTVRSFETGARDICWKVTPPEHGLDARLAAEIPHALGTAAKQVLQQRPIGGIFACGGEVAAALLESMDVHSLEIEGEVQPLVVTGKVRGGTWDRLPVITKGGLVGDDRAITASIGRLHEMQKAYFGTAEDRRPSSA